MLQPPYKPLAPLSVFFRRLGKSIALSLLIVVCTLMLGIAGYHWICDLDWIDAILNASMILGGMGPVNTVHTNGGKLFASAYALFCGLVIVVSMGFVLAPILHRMMHTFHLDELDDEELPRTPKNPPAARDA